MKSEHQTLLLVGLVVLLIALFIPRPGTLSAGVSAHLGNLRGSFELEAFDTQDNQKTMCLFYTPKCPHCKNFMPVWDKFFLENKDATDVKLTKVDCEQNPDVAEQFGVSSFPTVKFFPKGLAFPGKSKLYDGAREVGSLKQYLKSVSGTPDERTYQGGEISGPPAPVDLAGAGIKTVSPYLGHTFDER